MPRWVSGYYAANAALLASYAAVRLVLAPRLLEGGASAAAAAAPGRSITTIEELRQWEKQVLLALAAIVTFKLWRRRSWDHAAAQVFTYAKLVLALLVFVISPGLLAWYCLAFWAVYALLPQPIIDLAASGSVTALTPTTLKEASLATDAAWMVFFYTQSHGTSVAAAPVFLQVADEFASSKLRFGTFDVCVFPRAAMEAKLNTNTWSNQLPTVVLYEKGREWARLPPAEAINNPSKPNNYTRSDIIRLFKLEERFARPLDAAGTSAGAAKTR
ncbi:hypothetical protein Rsub_13070 [Raphidocelis subcapitata]|uniref:Thioredoxin domain-containing protein n=1 Tax=Raphidocelis subcapitata TaxID=307507 RepID=A0A2V0PRX8_9CHLO|nr:hypothetical protein Rsub_13070 [Raphidocelis subcapitata]|eukprot:GBG00338.1 hypothetical protein Rsub_13070 [Raphidocelis subcapitata]